MGRFGVSVRGVYGEGRENYGSIYEVSNVKTLGQTERELAELVCKVALQLNDQENQVRQMTLEITAWSGKTRFINLMVC